MGGRKDSSSPGPLARSPGTCLDVVARLRGMLRSHKKWAGAWLCYIEPSALGLEPLTTMSLNPHNNTPPTPRADLNCALPLL